MLRMLTLVLLLVPTCLFANTRRGKSSSMSGPQYHYNAPRFYQGTASERFIQVAATVSSPNGAFTIICWDNEQSAFVRCDNPAAFLNISDRLSVVGAVEIRGEENYSANAYYCFDNVVGNYVSCSNTEGPSNTVNIPSGYELAAVNEARFEPTTFFCRFVGNPPNYSEASMASYNCLVAEPVTSGTVDPNPESLRVPVPDGHTLVASALFFEGHSRGTADEYYLSFWHIAIADYIRLQQMLAARTMSVGPAE